ncbi:hypothetical protein GIB67_004147 [Kingdonia uniflora]|uniref:Rubredoxin-like domain-containing protein n=1 Tax=Kingdonia uniflora TaxID=39325 RepID=A0A7J7NRD4_9MAGN|nr:hypothetical protein GIB67_004147 [Kingdonia uniflora]
MALQAQARLNTSATSLLAPTGNPGLRRPSDRFALRSSFSSSSLHLLLSPPQKAKYTSAPRISMRTASKQAYICRDCGFIYNEKTPFEKQPDKYFCPVCGAPKRRFKVYEDAATKNANATDVRKARKSQLKKDEAIGKALPIGIAVGVIALLGLYFYLNSTL